MQQFERIKQNYLELLITTNSSISNDLVLATTDRYNLSRKPILTFYASKECRIEKFFTNDDFKNEDYDKLRRYNEYLNEEVENSHNPEFEKKTKLYSTRRYLIMTEEVIDEYNEKKLCLQRLRLKINDLFEKLKTRESEMSKKETTKIVGQGVWLRLFFVL